VGDGKLSQPLEQHSKTQWNEGRERRLKAGEYETLVLEQAKHGNPYFVHAFQLAIETSLRQSMLFKLQWSWVDLDNQLILNPLEFQLKGNKGFPRICHCQVLR